MLYEVITVLYYIFNRIREKREEKRRMKAALALEGAVQGGNA